MSIIIDEDEKLPNEVLLDKATVNNLLTSLKGNEVKVLLYLLVNRKENIVVINKAKCSSMLDISRDTLYKSLRRLRYYKLIEVEETSNTFKINKSLLI